jgi:hypothetical protein
MIEPGLDREEGDISIVHTQEKEVPSGKRRNSRGGYT